LAEMVEEAFSCLCRDFAKDGIIVNIRIPEALTIYAVRVQIEQVLMNLILNARDAMLPKGGVLTIRAQNYADAVQIEVSDTGIGIDSANQGRIFETFFTTKASEDSLLRRSGSGLGLAICKKIIDEHGGSISVESKPNEGAIFRILLPKSQSGTG
jgi:signal transduction histidine kinase